MTGKDRSDGSTNEDSVQISSTMMVAIIGLSIALVSMLIILATCYIRHMRGGSSKNPGNSGSATGTSESSLPESPEDYPFNRKAVAYDLQGGQHSRSLYNHTGLWSQKYNVYPASQQYPLLQQQQYPEHHWQPHQVGQPQPQKISFRNSHHDMLQNEYEVPFAHLLPQTRSIGSLSSINNLTESHSMVQPQTYVMPHSAASIPHIHQGYVHQQQPFIQRSKSSSMRPQPPQPPLKFFYHVDQ
jgi:hypothetical protein